MDDDEQFRFDNEKQRERKNDKLWQEMQIEFHLEAFRFPDNKIYGIINIIPESSRQLINKLVLVINQSNRIEFEPHYQHLSAAGLNTKRKNPSAYIEAIPNNPKWAKNLKTSKICYFFFTGQIFALSPNISFDWSDSEAVLIIKWYHLGDKLAQKYVLYLDETEIQYIRQKLIDDAFEVRIMGFKAGEKHTCQLVARLNNGKETYRTDLMEFTVPSKELNDNGDTEFITVSNELPPPDLPAIMATKGEKTEEDFISNDHIHRKSEKKTKLNHCCNQLPHEKFPGIEHYFRNWNHSRLSSETIDDDNDVILSNIEM